MAERKQTSPEVLRERSPAPRAFPRYWTTAILPPLVASPPSRERFASSGPHGTTSRKDSATLGRISLTTALGTRARLRAHATVPNTLAVEWLGLGYHRPSPVERRGKRDCSLFPHRSRGLIPLGPAASSPQRHQPFTLASRGFARGTICSDSSAEARQRRRPSPKPPHRLARGRETLFLRGRRH